MRKVTTVISPVIAVDRKSTTPLHRQIYDAYRAAIVGRNLRAGQQIPSSRGLATELGVSRIPVINAYSQLLAEGYFESRPGAGTFVSTSLPDQLISSEYRDQRLRKTHSGSRATSRASALLPPFRPAPWLYGQGPFTVGQVALDHFPFQAWSKLLARHWRSVRAESLYFSDPMGSESFRKTIATYLRTSRALNCEADQIIVVNGSQQALQISARVLLEPGNSVWIEEPSFRLTRHALILAGCKLIPVPVDEEGLNVCVGKKLCRKARAAFVTPSHQYPLGATMSASRRLQLLDWAHNTGSWIVEDDYDSEYRYKQHPISSLQGLDRGSRVIYIGTFSKTLFPSLRVGYLVVPSDLIERFVAVRHAMDVYPAHLYQSVLNDFIGEGHFSRHVRRTRLLYGERRGVLVEAIRDEFGSRLEVLGSDAGLHLVITLPKGVDDREISEHAAREHLWVWPLSPCYLNKNPRQGLILGFGNTPTNKIRPAVSRLRKVICSK
jgi:GntR family transcriptional regulator/MocR family aminotransferase